MLGYCLALIFANGCLPASSEAVDGVASFIQTVVVSNVHSQDHAGAQAGNGDPAGLVCSVILVVVLVPLLALPLCLGGARAAYAPEPEENGGARDLRAQAADLRERAAALCSEASQVYATQKHSVLPAPPKPAGPPPGGGLVSMRRSFQQIGPLLPLVMLMSVSLSALEANQGWIRLNFFAGHHTSSLTDVQCELTPTKYFCRAALEDKAGASVILSFVPPVVHLLLAPALGAASDARGRRSILMACQMLSVVPVFFTALFVFFRVSLYAAFVLSPLAELPVEALCLAWVADRVVHQADVAGAFGLVMAVKAASYLVGWVLGNLFSVKLATILSLIACLLATVYVWVCLPESLPAKKRKHLEKPLTMPGVGLRVLGRNSVSTRLAVVLAIALFVDKGFGEVSQEYLETYALDWNKEVGSVSLILDQVSSILWLCCLGALANMFGGMGTTCFARWAAILYVVSSVLTQQKWHVALVHFVFAGPLMLTFPMLAAACSTLVAPNEQGLMQGALGAVTSIVECLGPYIFFMVFDSSKGKPKNSLAANSMLVLHLACTAFTILLLMSVRWHLQQQQQKSLAQDDKVQAAPRRGDQTLG